MKAQALEALGNQIKKCKGCRLFEGRRKAVPGIGPATADIYLIAEAPGEEEDKRGIPLCLEESTRILTRELRWIPIGGVEVGQELYAVDENVNKGGGVSGFTVRRWRPSTVLRIDRRRAQCVRIITDDAAVIATPDHRWLTALGATGGHRKWLRSDELQTRIYYPEKHRSHLSRLLPVWDTGTSYKAGWLSGFYDGEGHLNTHRGNSKNPAVIYSQNDGSTHERALSYLDSLGFQTTNYGEQRRNGVLLKRPAITGGYKESLRFLGQIRPERLLDKFVHNLPEGETRTEPVEVLAVEPAGMRDVVDITTSTGTFLAEGMITHNCGRSGKKLSKIFEQEGLPRERFFLSNMVRCRPPGNRDPRVDEIETCRQWTEDQLDILEPKLIVAVGRFAVEQYFPGNKIRDVHGSLTRSPDGLVMATYHPAAALHQATLVAALQSDYHKLGIVVRNL